MIARLTGTLVAKGDGEVVLDVGGVGYEVSVPTTVLYTLPEPGTTVTLHVSTQFRDDRIQLFGFSSLLEKRLFHLLLSVSGVGPRLAMNILSRVQPRAVLEAVARGDTTALNAIPGVGKMTAERLVVELKGRVSALLPELPPAASGKEDAVADAVSALVNLGYRRSLAEEVCQRVAQRMHQEATVEALIRTSLAELAGRNG